MFYLKITLFRYRFYRGRDPTYLDRVMYSMMQQNWRGALPSLSSPISDLEVRGT